MSKFSFDVTAFGERISKEFKDELKGAWDKWSAEDKELVEDVAEQAALVAINHLNGDVEKAKKERAHIEAQLKNIKAAVAGGVQTVFWNSVARVVILAGKALFFH